MIFVNKVVDERFLEHRRRSTSSAGIVGSVLALVLFIYRHFANHFWSWDLFAVGLTFVVVKLAFMTWYHLTD